jgi:trk system potassium uptake protein TrkA
MYIIVVGCGNLGFYVAEMLMSEHHDVVVIDKDSLASQKVANDLDLISITGDGTEPSVLEKAGIERANVLVSLTETDETNLIIGLMAKEYGVKTVAVSLSKVHYHGPIIKKLGIDLVIHPEAAAAGYITQLITQPDVLDLSFFSKGDAEIVEVSLDDKSSYIGKDVKYFNNKISGETRTIGMYKKGKFLFTTDDMILSKNDKLLVISMKSKVSMLRKMK